MLSLSCISPSASRRMWVLSSLSLSCSTRPATGRTEIACFYLGLLKGLLSRIIEMLNFYEQLHSISEIETTSALDVTLKFKIQHILPPALGLKRLIIAVLAAQGGGQNSPYMLAE